MNKLFTLFRTLRKCRGISFEKSDSGMNKESLYLVVGIFLSAILGYAGYNASPFVPLLGGLEKIIGALGVVSCLACIVLSAKNLIASLYMSSDIDALIVMPITPIQIVLLRMLDVLIGLFGIAFVALAPFSVGYMLGTSFDFSLCITALLLIVCIPLFICCAVAGIIILVMRVAKIFRNRELLTLLGLLFAVALGVVYLFVRNSSSDAEQMATNAIGTLDKIKNLIPIIKLSVGFFTGKGIICLIGVLGCTALSIVLFLIMARYFYLGGALNMLDSAGSERELTPERLGKMSKKRPIMRALIIKDIKLNMRTPAFFMNNLLLIWAMPIIAVIMLLFVGNYDISTVAELNENIGICSLLTLLVFPFFGLFTRISVSAFSRDGDDLFSMGQLPVTKRKQIAAKQYVSLFVYGISTLLFPAILFCALWIKGVMLWQSCVLCFLLCIPMTLTLVRFGIIFDLICPDINRTNEADIGKGNTYYILFVFGFLLFNIIVSVLSIIVGDVVGGVGGACICALISLVLQSVLAFIGGKIMYSFGIRALKNLYE